MSNLETKTALKIKKKEGTFKTIKSKEEKELEKLEEIEAKIEAVRVKIEEIKNEKTESKHELEKQNQILKDLRDEKAEIEEKIEEEIEKQQEKKDEIQEKKNNLTDLKGNIINDFNFIISQNQVIFTDKITNKEIKNGGKYSAGYDYATGHTVQVLDKDYGKSAELMRALLETEAPTPLWKKVLLFFIISGIALLIGIVIFSLIPTAEAPDKVEKKSSFLPTNVGQSIDVTKGQVEVKKEPEKVEEIKEAEKIGPLNNEVLQHSNEIDILKKDYEIESLKLEAQRIIDEKNLLTQENFELSQEIEKKDEIIKELKENTPVCEEKPKNLTQEAFLLHLGNLVYKGCEKAELEGQKNKCKDLYFEYIKND